MQKKPEKNFQPKSKKCQPKNQIEYEVIIIIKVKFAVCFVVKK